MSTFFSGLFVFSSPPEKSHPITISIEWLFQLSIWSFTLIISFQDYFRILPDCADPLFGFSSIFKNFPSASDPWPILSRQTRPAFCFRSAFPKRINILSSHWTFPPFQRLFYVSFLLVSLYYTNLSFLSIVFWKFLKFFLVNCYLSTTLFGPALPEPHISPEIHSCLFGSESP